ncbi:MAG: hypothetical protein F6K48_20895 [Okeania sp. SIO3H1]|nr:hypothetical protein [Okeania sp. SIO3H1]NET26751.1 hypothetical protein [Okeania sp. SIO1I7]
MGGWTHPRRSQEGEMGRFNITALFTLDEPHPHTSNLVGTFHGMSLLWSTV